jgi:endonuclease YncB( thermonuclease family)
MSTKLYHYGLVAYDVYDGDTVRVILDLGYNIPFGHVNRPVTKWPAVRIVGIDTPEVRKKRQRQAGYAVRDVVNMVMSQHQKFIVQSIKLDKYAGRFIGDILMGEEEISLSQFVLDNKIGRVYRGDKKKPWPDRTLKIITNRCRLLLAAGGILLD